MGFSSFSLVYRTEVMSLVEVMTPSLIVIQMREKGKEKEVFAAKRCEDLERLDEKREEAQECSHRYRQRMTKAYGRMTKDSVCGGATHVKSSKLRQVRYGRTI